jgi:hypothetical protein
MVNGNIETISHFIKVDIRIMINVLMEKLRLEDKSISKNLFREVM